ncbi:hypothetical protein IHE44_0013340, partial [Lamprotornis superbus]
QWEQNQQHPLVSRAADNSAVLLASDDYVKPRDSDGYCLASRDYQVPNLHGFLPTDCGKWTADFVNTVWPCLLQSVPPFCPSDCQVLPNLQDRSHSRSIPSHLYI